MKKLLHTKINKFTGTPVTLKNLFEIMKFFTRGTNFKKLKY